MESLTRMRSLASFASITIVLFLRPAAAETDPLSLERALELARERHPALAARAAELAARVGGRAQASVYPNPRLGLTSEDAVGSDDFAGGARAETTLEVSERIELGGKRARRIDVADRRIAVAEHARDVTRATVEAEVRERFGHVLADRERRRVRRRGTALAERSLDVVERQVVAGRLLAAESHRARVLLERSRLEEEHAEHELRAARRRLATSCGIAGGQLPGLVGDLFAPPPAPFEDVEDAMRRLAGSPRLRRAAAEAALGGASIALERAEVVPDVDLSVGARRYEHGDDLTLVFGFSVPIPVLDRNRGNVARALAERDAADHEREALEAELAAELYGLLQEHGHAVTELESLERIVAPRAAEALGLSRGAFESGRLSHLELLDAQRTWIDVALQRIDAAAELWRLRAEIGARIGDFGS